DSEKCFLGKVLGAGRISQAAAKEGAEWLAITRIQFLERVAGAALKVEHQGFVADHDSRRISYVPPRINSGIYIPVMSEEAKKFPSLRESLRLPASDVIPESRPERPGETSRLSQTT